MQPLFQISLIYLYLLAFTFDETVISGPLPMTTWIMDSEATSHFTYNKNDFVNGL